VRNTLRNKPHPDARESIASARSKRSNF
jgi:hypothetical protein